MISVAGAAPGPLHITAKPDFAHTASAVLDEKGGTLRATAADGTTFVLALPAGALGGKLRISLTPIGSQADGYPFKSGISAGAELEPEGLMLFRAATLQISFARDPQPKTLMGFCAAEDGVDFHLCAPTLKGRVLEFQIVHFSTVGSGDAAPAETGAFVGAHTPGSNWGNAEQQIAALLQQARNAPDPSAAGDALFNGGLDKTFKDWGEPLATSLDAWAKKSASQDVSKDEIAIRANELLAWSRAVATTGADKRFEALLARMFDDLHTVLDNMAIRAVRACWDAKDSRTVYDIVDDAVWFSKEAQLIENRPDEPDVIAMLQSCLRFTVGITSTMLVDLHGTQVTVRLEGQIVVTPMANAVDGFSGTGDVAFTFADVTPNPKPGACALNWSRGKKSADVLYLKFASSASYNEHHTQPVHPGRPVTPSAPDTVVLAKGQVEHISFSPNDPKEQLAFECDVNGQKASQGLGSFWSQYFDLAHVKEGGLYEGKNLYGIFSWDQDRGGVRSLMAHKSYNRRVPLGAASVTETTSFEVTHTPLDRPKPHPASAGPVVALTVARLRERYTDNIGTHLDRAKTDARFTRDEFDVLDEWLGQARRFFPDALKPEIAKSTSEALAVFDAIIDQTAATCSSGNVDSAATMLGFLQWAKSKPLISAQAGFDPDAVKAKIEACARFSVQFSSDLTTGKAGNPMHLVMKGFGILKSTLDLTNGRLILTGDVPEEYTVLSWPQSDCKVQARAIPDTLHLTRIELQLNTDKVLQEHVDVRFAEIDPGKPAEDLVFTCPDGKDGSTRQGMWAILWQGLHQSEYLAGAGNKLVDHSDAWIIDPPGRGSYATKTYRWVMGGAEGIKEDTTLKLVHQPIQR